MTVARGVAFGALAVAVVVVAVLFLGGGGKHTYYLQFQNAGQLVKDDDVQVGGRRVGSVRDISLTNDNQARIRIEVQNGFAPLHEGTTATIRATSLSGVANRYIALTPGPQSNRALPDKATLSTAQTTSPVDLDQLFNALDPATRKGLQQVIQGSATQYAGKGAQANAAGRYFNPALSTTRHLVNEVVSDQTALSLLIKNGSAVTRALAARGPTLTNLVTNANTTAAAIGSENVALARALGLLPGTLRRANTTFVNLRSTLDDLDKLVSASKPVAPKLAPFFRALRPLVADARPTIHDLRLLIRRPGPDNDFIELLRKTPRLEKLAKPAFADSIASLRKSLPVLSFIRPYAPDFVGWLRDFGQGASTYDANGHYARIQPMFNALSFSDNPAGGVLTPQSQSARDAGLSFNNAHKCPGTASQNPTDNSAPFRDTSGQLDCDPNAVPPGP
ncbi:MAG TPA: MlaD family protein [Solirubrobacteraceae bacterium]|jgi:phospholipid/cholesterol/gamma-HCH transport system substrate-binding protein